ncbi:hypothetical protein BJ508DRAFT_336840 [Ascobolus immersus RN42]|uniref:Uncharacterized protein n=1 Tax=Ascobolus immersus RN42 TaxID=1160509 RepID=A0A3N4HM56_ASCIM|nr:hypothetical protein BJ508DRAFT_336840 [Ascobolus immersus RN42]
MSSSKLSKSAARKLAAQKGMETKRRNQTKALGEKLDSPPAVSPPAVRLGPGSDSALTEDTLPRSPHDSFTVSRGEEIAGPGDLPDLPKRQSTPKSTLSRQSKRGKRAASPLEEDLDKTKKPRPDLVQVATSSTVSEKANEK